MNTEFPSRKEILEKKSSIPDYKQNIIEQVKYIDTNKIDFEASDFKPRHQVVEKQKIYRWTRLFVKEETLDIQVNDIIKLHHLPTDEILESQFICFGKKGLEKDSEGNIVAFDGEEDKQVLCLMIDTQNLESDNVKFIRSLFQNTKWYEFQLMKRSELLFINQRTGEPLDYFDVEF